MPKQRRPAWLIEHGTSIQEARRCRTYNGGRACTVCVATKALREREGYDRRVARLIADPTIRPHGVHNTYSNWGCRCDLCYEDHLARQRRRRGFSSRLTLPRGRRPKIAPFGREWIDA